jgi:hypothetical protein
MVGALKEKKQVSYTDERANFRHAHQRQIYMSLGVKNSAEKTSDWKEITRALLQVEGHYTGTREGKFTKNEYMQLIEAMAISQQSNERIQAALALGSIRVDFPEFSDRKSFPGQSSWVDEILIFLGTDRDPGVRRAAILALNMNASATQNNMKELKRN